LGRELTDTGMSKKSPRVAFKLLRIAAEDWQIEAACEHAETKIIKGFTSKQEVDEWLAGEGQKSWLRANGYAK
jgi:hypothetical protein